jgi:chromosome segregation ATPase
MTKQEEIALLEKFCSKLPEGYLKDIFIGNDLQGQIESAIKSDICFVDCLPHLQSQVAALRTEYNAKQFELGRTDQRLEDAQRQLTRLKDEAANVADKLNTISFQLSKI